MPLHNGKNETMNAVSIRKYRLCKHESMEGKPFLVYSIHIKTPTGELRIRKRFSEIKSLHQKVLRLCPSITLPEFPPNGPGIVCARGDKFLNARLAKLEEYLNKLLNQRVVTTSSLYKEFLSTEEKFVVVSDD